MAETETRYVFRKPVPESVTEVKGIGAGGGIVTRADGTLLLAQGSEQRISADGGRSWSEPEPFPVSVPVGGMIRLASGALAFYGSSPDTVLCATSADDGRTWSEPTPICPTSAGRPMFRSMIQLRSGRLLVAMYWEGLDGWEYRNGTMESVHPDLQYMDVSAYGEWRGQRVQIEGHAHAPEMGMTVVYRSDDDGATWTKHLGGLMGWFDFDGNVNGMCGQTGCFEPTLAETADGNVLLIMRNTVGRLVQSFSTDGGEHWHSVRPTDLPSSESPAMMATLPETGDLLLVWNQMSREEVRRGYRRGRLSSAISRDGGHSWSHWTTLELSDGLEDVDRIPPEFPLQMTRARDWVGPLPDGWAYFHYANIDIIGDSIVLRYSRGTPQLGVAEQNLHKQEAVLRIYPIQWFYG